MQEYKFKPDANTWYWTIAYFISFGSIAAAIFLFYDGGYMLAWVIAITIAIIALMALSIPRRIVANDEALDIYCISDFTTLPYESISSARVVEQKEMLLMIPIFAGVGFFGYYGCFFNLRKAELVKIYASRWNNFIEVTDKCEEKYYLSCDNPQELVALINQHIHSDNEYKHTT